MTRCRCSSSLIFTKSNCTFPVSIIEIPYLSCLLSMFTHGLCCILSVSPRHCCTNHLWLTPGLCCQSCKLGVKYDDCIKLPPATLQQSQARLLIITLVVILIKNLHALKNTKCVHSNPEGQDTSGCSMLKCPCPPS